jgi:hypothetical protein
VACGRASAIDDVAARWGLALPARRSGRHQD